LVIKRIYGSPKSSFFVPSPFGPNSFQIAQLQPNTRMQLDGRQWQVGNIENNRIPVEKV
jgi:hypothetical protein